MHIHLVYQPTTLARAFNANLGNLTENKHYRIARQFESTAGLKVHNILVSSGRDGQIPMAVLHSSFSFGLNTLLEMCILLHLSTANNCTIVVSEEHEMASFIPTEQCVNVAYLYGPLVVDNNRMNCKHGMLRSSQ